MMVDAANGEIVGLAGQELFYRQPAPEGENSYQALQRPRESEVWGRVIEQVGSPATGVRFIHVFDRGADNLDVFCHCRQQRTDWVIRAAQLHRTVEATDAESEVQRRVQSLMGGHGLVPSPRPGGERVRGLRFGIGQSFHANSQL